MEHRRFWLRSLLGIGILAALLSGPVTLASATVAYPGQPTAVNGVFSGMPASVTLKGDAPIFSGPITQTITFTPPTAVTTHKHVSLTATATSGLPVSFTSDTPGVCTVSGSVATTTKPGTCTITATQPGNVRWAAANETQSFSVTPLPITPRDQTITFMAPPAVTAHRHVTLTATATSGLPVSFTSDTPGVCTVSGSVATTTKPGTCTITATQPGNADWAPAANATQSFPVTPNRATRRTQTITFTAPPAVTTHKQVALTATATSGLPVSFSTDTPGVCTVTGAVASTTKPGTCTITATQPGNAHWAPAANATRSFKVMAAKAVKPVASITLSAAALALVAAILAVAAAAGIVLQRRRRLRSPRPLAQSVRAEPHMGPPDLVSVHATGTEPTHTVRVEPNPGGSVTTMRKARS